MTEQKPTTAIARITMYRDKSAAPRQYAKHDMWADLKAMIDYCDALESRVDEAQDKIAFLQSRNGKLQENLERFLPGTKNKTVGNYGSGSSNNHSGGRDHFSPHNVRNGQEV